jgi:mono/diheme cytochrome c family protein
MLRFAIVAAGSVFGAALAAETPVEFNRDIRPILSDKCFGCHGPDAKTKNIPLRLDVEEAAKGETRGRRAIVAGDPAASTLMQRITAEKPALRMPPPYTGTALSAEEIETLRQWIRQGAKWQQHWSFLKPERPALPVVKNKAWVRNPIDTFVLARLEREGLAPAPEAGRETLLRRVTLDLTGLPPTLAEIDGFLRDSSPNAYEKVVERLLKSPRYGERMAARWLDAARYADTNGYQFDGERIMWRWRDWVIDAFNRNLPYDQFVIEQLAGDLLPKPTLDQLIATGFNRNHRGNTEDGIVPEEYAVEYVVDRVETAATVFLGLTMGCARCHNHKYDPISQREFYQFFAYFNNVPEFGRAMKYGNSPPLIPAPTREQQQAHQALNERIAAVDRQLAARREALARLRAGWQATAWYPTSGRDTWEAGGEFRDKPAVLAGKGAFDIDDAFTVGAWVTPETTDHAAIVTRMSDGEKGRGYGVYLEQGRIHVHLTSNYADDAIRVETEQRLAAGARRHILVTYDGSVAAAGLKIYIDGELAPVKVLLDTLYRPFRNAGRKFTEPLRIGGGGGRGYRGRIEDVLVYSRVVSAEERAVLAHRAEERRQEWAFLETAAPAPDSELWRRKQGLLREREALERQFPTTMVMAESAVPKVTHLLIRGAYDKKGEVVEPGVPAVLPPLPPGAPNNRLGLAQWMVSPDNPLTARVAVNRFWQLYFGAGLVRTAEDFGQQGEWPSHPELLDWLATEFIRTGWDVKAMQKLIVISSTYRQASHTTPELMQKDPDNRLLARGPRFRLPAEMIRDQALAAAGLLRDKIGGPSVKPYQPEGLWNDLSMQDMHYVQSKGDDLYRRSLYTFWKRTIAPPMMVNFDAANREACVVRETRTNTPLQALNLMNDVTFLEAARFLAERMLKEAAPDTVARLTHGFRLATGRAPLSNELEVLAASLAWHAGYFSSAPDKAVAYVSLGESPGDKRLKPAELAAYTAVASLLLNLDETVTKE